MTYATPMKLDFRGEAIVKAEISDGAAASIGKRIAEVLELQERDGWFATSHGKKTDAGLGRAVAAIVLEHTALTWTRHEGR